MIIYVSGFDSIIRKVVAEVYTGFQANSIMQWGEGEGGAGGCGEHSSGRNDYKTITVGKSYLPWELINPVTSNHKCM